MQKSTEFFRNLPPKICSKCGHRIDEQHESYTAICENCTREKKNR